MSGSADFSVQITASEKIIVCVIILVLVLMGAWPI
jgi:hypothetical protein